MKRTLRVRSVNTTTSNWTQTIINTTQPIQPIQPVQPITTQNSTNLTTFQNQTTTVINTTISSPLQCPIGQYFTGSSCLVLSTSIRCDVGFAWNGFTCFRSSVQTTPLNQTITTTNVTTIITCPTGYYYNGAVCLTRVGQIVCLSGYAYNETSGNCVQLNQSLTQTFNQFNNQQIVNQSSTQQTNQIINNVNIQRNCFSGYTNINGQCVYSGSTVCPFGSYFNGISCVSNIGSIGCANGFIWNSAGTQCIPSSATITTNPTISSFNTTTTSTNTIIGGNNYGTTTPVFTNIDAFNNYYSPSTSFSSINIPITPNNITNGSLIPITTYPTGTITNYSSSTITSIPSATSSFPSVMAPF